MIEKRMAAALGNDPKLMKRMIPDFPLGCRRLGPAEGFLECFLQSNVTLAEGDIKTFTEKGIKTSTGQEYEADVIICATGFDVSFKPYFPVIGRDGRTLAKEWADDPNAYMAMAAHGFPNFMSEFFWYGCRMVC
jgi:cation diffusion facilitator CzcD-associated flavoprotein CzcO